MWDSEVGHVCHWCGKYVMGKRGPKTGNHLFCCNACKMAHRRAFAKWLKNSVTQGAPAGGPLVKRAGDKSNADRGPMKVLTGGRPKTAASLKAIKDA